MKRPNGESVKCFGWKCPRCKTEEVLPQPEFGPWRCLACSNRGRYAFEMERTAKKLTESEILLGENDDDED